MKSITLTLVTVALIATTAHAAPTGVDCDAVALGSLNSYLAHYPKQPSYFNADNFQETLKTYCDVGVGGYMTGKPLTEMITNAANAASIANGSDRVAALLSAAIEGYLYKSAHEILLENKVPK